jgi:putative hydrolase of HD superfamily
MHDKRIYNNFFSALFHDLPEAVTRDIISPVKTATQGLPSIVKQIEDEIVKRELVPLMEDFYADELLYFTSNEFDNRICVDKNYTNVQTVSFDELNVKYNDESFSPVDGALVRCADHAAAFIEADSSIKYGITSAHLREGRENIRKIYPAGRIISGFKIGDFFAHFS